MGMNEHYEDAESLLKCAKTEIDRILGSDGDDVSCHHECVINHLLSVLANAKAEMALGRYVEKV
jgi:hypothetical protein